MDIFFIRKKDGYITFRGSSAGMASDMFSPIVTSSSFLWTIYSRQSLASYPIHVASKVLRMLLGLVEIRAIWPRHPK